jgi:hypothetical protein
MKYSRKIIVRGLFLLLPATLLPLNVSLAAIEEFSPYAYGRVVHDSNIFRVSGDTTDQQSDTIGHLGVGLESDWKLSRQHLLLDALVDRAKYDGQGQLDHTYIDGLANWAWQVGNLWDGNLGYEYKKELSSFTEQLVPTKDMRTTHRGFWNGGYQIHPDWKVSAGVDYADVSYQDRNFLDRKTTTGSLAVQYKNTRNTYVGVAGDYAKNDLKDLEIAPGTSVNSDYNVATISGIFSWEGSEKSSLEARLGYTDVRYDDLNDLDFQGTTGRLIYHWTLTEKTRMDAEIWRETTSLNNEITSYVLQKGVSIKPVWLATPKIKVRGRVAYTNDDFKARNDVAAAVGVQRRNDDTWKYGIGTTWSPRPYFNLSLDYRRETRDSSINARDYNDDMFIATIRFQL